MRPSLSTRPRPGDAKLDQPPYDPPFSADRGPPVVRSSLRSNATSADRPTNLADELDARQPRSTFLFQPAHDLRYVRTAGRLARLPGSSRRRRKPRKEVDG